MERCGGWPEESRRVVLAVVRAHFTDDVFLEWAEAAAGVEGPDGGKDWLPGAFEAAYLGAGRGEGA